MGKCYRVPLSIFITGFAKRVTSSARPLSLIPLGTGTWPPTVCDGNFRSVLHPRVFFSVPTSHGSNRAGRPLFKTLSKAADATEYPDEKAARASCKQFKSFPWIGVCQCTFVYLNSKTGRNDALLFPRSFVRRHESAVSSSSLTPGVFWMRFSRWRIALFAQMRLLFSFYTRGQYFFFLSLSFPRTCAGCYTCRRYTRIERSKKPTRDRTIPTGSIIIFTRNKPMTSKLAAKFPVVKAAKNGPWFYKTRVTWAMMPSSRWQNTYYGGKIKPEPRTRMRSLSGRLFVVNKIKKKMRFRFVELC